MLRFFKSTENRWYKPTRREANDSTVKRDKVCKPIRLNVFFLISFTILRSSHPEVFCKKDVLKNFTKFTASGKGVFL